MLVLIGHIHEVILKGVVIVVFEAAWREFAGDNVDGWTWKTSAAVFPQVCADSWRTAKTR